MSVAITRILESVFGETSLASANNGKVSWVRGNTSPLDQKSPTGWLACLYGGVQTGDDWARVNVPVFELSVKDFNSAMWSYYMSATETMGVNMVIWVHDPKDPDKRAEITQLGNVSGLDKAVGWNSHVLNTATTQFFFYGENTTGTALTAGTQYTWAEFQADVLFKTWTIYRITLEYGWEASGTFDNAYVADIKLNGMTVYLRPDVSPKTVVALTKILGAASAYHATDVLSEATSSSTDWDFDIGFTGYITYAMVVSENTAVTPRLVLHLFSFPPTCVLNDHATSTSPKLADLANFIGSIEFQAMTSIAAGMSYAIATPSTYGNLPLLYGSSKVYGVLQTLDAFTQTAGNDMTIFLGAEG